MGKNAFLFSAGEYTPSSLSINNLNETKNDVVAIEKRLLQIGFKVEKFENSPRANYISALKTATEKFPGDAISIVYFTGHGGHYNGENYIFPSDFGSLFDSSKSVANSGINIKEIIDIFKGKGYLVLILDACRGDVGLSKGHYSEMTVSDNVYIAYGTTFQGKSSMSSGRMSWFTEAICDEILTPNIDVDTLFMHVRQNIITKHKIQIPSSVNTLLNKVVLHTELNYDERDLKVHDFIKKYGDSYNDKYGYFHGDDLIFLDAAQYYDVGLLDAIWMFNKVDNKQFKDRGVDIPDLPEAESKIVSFLGLTKGSRFFRCDPLSHTWYYNGRQIRMGEIPPLPPSMQQKLPETGKEICVKLEPKKNDGHIEIQTNLPDGVEVFVWNDNTKLARKEKVVAGAIKISDAQNVSKVIIDSGVFSNDASIKAALGEKNRNLVGEFIEYHPINGNLIHASFEF